MTTPVPQRVDSIAVTVSSGGSLSAAVNLGGRAPVAVLMSAGWDSASLTFQASMDGTTYGDVWAPDVSGTQAEVAHAVAAGRFVALDANAFAGARFLKLRSGTSGSAVNQTADRVLTLITREFW